MSGKLRVTLKRSRIGVKKSLKKTLDSMGLRRINQSRIFNDTPSVQGMIFKVNYLIEVEKLEAKDES